MNPKRYLQQRLRHMGLDIRRTGRGYDVLTEISLMCQQAQASEADRLAGAQFLSGLGRLLEAGIAPQGQLLQDALALGSRQEPGYFLEIGAGHPTYLSNTDSLVSSFGWEGLRVDPNPAFAVLHRQNPRPGVTFVEAAIGDSDGDQREFVIADELTTRIDLISRDGHKGTRERALREVAVASVTMRRLDSLLAEVSAPRQIQFLSLDTEGSEAEILDSFPFMTHTIDVVAVEHNYRMDDSKRIDGIMCQHGYTRVLAFMSGWDAWYINEQRIESLR